MKNWITNVKANKGKITEATYLWAGESFIKIAIVIGVTWAVATLASGWITPEEIKTIDD